ncbi:MAG: hypothetical protein WBW04_00660 [Nitrolancea sp.]
MAVAYFSKLPNTPPETAEKVVARIRAQLGNRRPDGAIFHAEGPTDDGGWWAFNIWDSDDASENFGVEFLRPTLNSLGIAIPREDRLEVNWETSSESTRT